MGLLFRASYVCSPGTGVCAMGLLLSKPEQALLPAVLVIGQARFFLRVKARFFFRDEEGLTGRPALDVGSDEFDRL
jgi:hypothetical protein